MKPIFILGVASLAALLGQTKISSGTQIEVRTTQPIRVFSDEAKGKVYDGIVAGDITNSAGRIVFPSGSKAEIIVRHVGPEQIAIALATITVGQHRYSIDASEQSARKREGTEENQSAGDIVGSVAGTQLVTRGPKVNIPAESVLTFRMEKPLPIDVRAAARP
jgi:hypothetical protein